VFVQPIMNPLLESAFEVTKKKKNPNILGYNFKI